MAAVAPPVAIALWAGPAPAATAECRSVSLAAELRAGEAYAQEIGDGLTLTLTPHAFAEPRPGESEGPDGWSIALAPAGSRADRIYPVNPPLRFNPLQDIGTSYGIAAKERLAGPFVYRFVAAAADYERISPLVTAALWPYAAPDPDHAFDDYATALGDMRTGVITLRPLRYELSADGERIRRLAFALEITAPPDFPFLPSLVPTAAACPPRAE